jgi:hypothetical protein
MMAVRTTSPVAPATMPYLSSNLYDPLKPALNRRIKQIMRSIHAQS